MRKIIIYIAASVDGKIAKPNGNIDWLNEGLAVTKTDYGYKKFYKSIDTTLIGNNTYKKILKFGIDFPYKGKENFVITSNKKIKQDTNVTFISNNIIKSVKKIKEKDGKNIWLVGGGKLNSYLMKNKLVDEIKLFTMPIVLGTGIPMFNEIPINCKLELQSSKKYATGVVELNFRCKYEK